MPPLTSARLLIIAARTGIVLVALAGGLRLIGKHQIGQMNIYDLILVMALANAVQNAMTEGRGQLSVGFVLAATLLIIGRLASSLFTRLPKLEERVVGTPTIVIHDGQWVRQNMRRECVTEEQLDAALREHGLQDRSQVKLAVLEVDGALSVVAKKERKK